MKDPGEELKGNQRNGVVSTGLSRQNQKHDGKHVKFHEWSPIHFPVGSCVGIFGHTVQGSMKR